ncbi:50S ribosomal protein L9 [Salinisphaera sp. SPP-AMP-43]|uniref:50S ribosomal protein L9 n=1 Tax=Salinisphaera sp. SPP-AMP-43 TaxID=3121288 RepID=UPI003C6DD653
MDIILLQKIRNLGDLGDTVKVRAGYGRNYLFPRGMALPATRENLAIFEERRSELQAASEEREDRAKLRADQLRNKSFTIAMRASDEGKLYGSVGPQEIAQAVNDEGFELDPREITLTEGTIRQVGYYLAELTLHAEVVCNIEIVVAQQTDMGINMPARVNENTEDDATAEEVEGERVEDAGEPADASATEADEPIGEREEP